MCDSNNYLYLYNIILNITCTFNLVTTLTSPNFILKFQEFFSHDFQNNSRKNRKLDSKFLNIYFIKAKQNLSQYYEHLVTSFQAKRDGHFCQIEKTLKT